MMKRLFTAAVLLLISCKQDKKQGDALAQLNNADVIKDLPADLKTPEGMVWVPGGKFTQGASENDKYALDREKPRHPVAVDGFFIDITEVTNADFKKFVDATGYVTVAERPVDWEEMKKQLPPDTEKPADSILQPGSLVFRKNVKNITDYYDYYQWWEWKIGANWKQPYGKGSSIEGKDHYPVVHVCYEDAQAYCKWANRRLPTEAEWELAAKGTLVNAIFTWGNEESRLDDMANTWQGKFPENNEPEDGYPYAAPVRSYPPNSLGIYDMAGNVWELTQDWYDIDYYKKLADKGVVKNPQGPAVSYNPENPYQKEKVIKGGSFLCNASYCASFRISAKMGMNLDSASDHTGFRTVATINMLQEHKDK